MIGSVIYLDVSEQLIIGDSIRVAMKTNGAFRYVDLRELAVQDYMETVRAVDDMREAENGE